MLSFHAIFLVLSPKHHARHLDKITAKIWSWGHAFTISDRGYDVEQSNKIFELARKKAAHVVGIDLENIDEWSLVNIIHEILSQKGEIQDVDYLLSRELFFRGMAAATVFSFIGFLLRYFSGKPIFEPTVALPNWIFLVTAIVSVLGVRRAMVSHRHMAKMRVRKLVIGFLAVHLSADAASQADASA